MTIKEDYITTGETDWSVWLKERSWGSLSQGSAPEVRRALQQRKGLLQAQNGPLKTKYSHSPLSVGDSTQLLAKLAMHFSE